MAEEQFVLRVPPHLAERLERMLTDGGAPGGPDSSLQIEFEGDGRMGAFVVGGERFPAALMDLPCIVESWKTYDSSNLVKAADVGQMIEVREAPQPPPESWEHRDGLTPPMRDARRRRFRREADINPEIVEAVERDLQSILAGGTAKDVDVEVVEHEVEEDDGEAASEGQRAAGPPPAGAASPPPGGGEGGVGSGGGAGAARAAAAQEGGSEEEEEEEEDDYDAGMDEEEEY